MASSGGPRPSRVLFMFILVTSFVWFNVKAEALKNSTLLPRYQLYKCSKSVNSDFIPIPKFLQIKYVEAKKKWWAQKLHPNHLYNFSLVWEGGLKCKSFELNIGKTQDNSLPDWYFFTPDGFLNYNRQNGPGELEQEITFHRNNYCISGINASQITVHACKSTCGTRPEEKGSALCIRKCCTFGQVKTHPDGDCKDVSGADWEPQIWPDLDSKNNSSGIYPQFERTDSQNWNCTSRNTTDQSVLYRALFHAQKDLRVVENGRIFWKKSALPEFDHWKQMFPRPEREKFCLDGFWNTSTGTEYNQSVFEYYSIRCDLSRCEELELNDSRTDPEQVKLASDLAYHHTITFSIFLLTALIFFGLMSIYASIWTVQNVHGWTIFVFLANSFLYNASRCAQSAWFAFGDTSLLITASKRPTCVSLGLLLQFSIIGSFAWTTVFSFDVWSKIRSIQKQKIGYKGQKKFAAYCLAGFTIPILWVIITVIMEFGSGFKRHEPDGIIRPGIRRYCEVNTTEFLPYFLYVGLPIILLFLTCMVLASFTVKFIWDTKKNIGSVDASKMSAGITDSVKLGLKLFVMMGVFLVVEAVQTFQNLSAYSVHWVWIEVYRIFHAIGLIFILVANGRVFNQLKQVFPVLGRLRLPLAKESTAAATTSAGTGVESKQNSTTN